MGWESRNFQALKVQSEANEALLEDTLSPRCVQSQVYIMLGQQVRELFMKLPREERAFAGMPPYSEDVERILQQTTSQLPSRKKVRIGFVIEDPQVVGYTQATIVRESHLQWSWLFTHPECRHNGYAQELFEKINVCAQDLEIPIRGSVLRTNTPMQRWLEKRGFHPYSADGTLIHYDKSFIYR